MSGGPISPAEAIRIAQQICETLDANKCDAGSMMIVVSLVLTARAHPRIRTEDEFQHYLSDLMHLSLKYFSDTDAAYRGKL